MNGDCLHSYCKDCIEENAKFSQLCSVCSKPLSSPLSSLPINYSLLHWRSLSSPLLTDKNNNSNNNINKNNNNNNNNINNNKTLLHWRSLSPPLPTDKNNNNINNLKTINVKIELHKINNSINKRIKLEEEKECTSSPLSRNHNHNQKRCEECEENKAELHSNEVFIMLIMFQTSSLS